MGSGGEGGAVADGEKGIVLKKNLPLKSTCCCINYSRPSMILNLS